MRGKAHLATGLIAGLVAAISTVSATTQIAEPIALTVAAAVGSLIPDMDLPTSTVGKNLNRYLGQSTKCSDIALSLMPRYG